MFDLEEVPASHAQELELDELDPRGEADRFGQQLDVALDVALAGPGGAAGLSLGAPGGSAPLLSVALDAQDRALKGAVLTKRKRR